MPRELGKRKNTQARINSNERSQGVGVHHTLDVQAERTDLSGFQQGLKSIHSFYQKKQEKADRLTQQQAIYDASHDEVDLERQEDDIVYRQTVNSQLGSIHAADKISQITLDYEERLKEDPNMDFNEFMQDVQNISQEDYDDPDYLESFNKKMGQTLDFLRTKHELNVANMELEQANHVASGMFDTLISDGDLRNITPTEGDMKSLYDQYAELGLDPEESIDSLAKSALHYASQGKHQAAESLLEFIKPNDVNTGKYGRQLRDAIDLSKQKAEEEAQKVEAVTAKAKYVARRDLTDQARTGRYNEAEALDMLEDGLVTESQLLSIREIARSAMASKVEEATTERMTHLAIGNPLLAIGMEEADRTKVDSRVNEMYRGMAGGLIDSFMNLKSTGDTTGFHLQVSEVLAQNGSLLNYSVQRGQIPKPLQELFRGSSLNNPNFEAHAELYKQLSAMSNDRVDLGLTTGQEAMLQVYNTFRDVGRYTHKEAVEAIAERSGITPGQAMSGLKSDIGKGEFEEMVKDNLGDLIGSSVELHGVDNAFYKWDKESQVEMFLRPAMKHVVMDMASANYRLSGNAKESVKFALERIKSLYVPVNGSLVPKENKPPVFFKAFDELQAPLLGKAKRGAIKVPEGYDMSVFDDGFTLVPIDGHHIDGRMRLAPASLPAVILTDKEGNPLSMRPMDVVSEYMEYLQVDHAEEIDAATLKSIQDKKGRKYRKGLREELQKEETLGLKPKF